MLKRLFLLFVLFLTLSSALFSATLDSIISSAKENSPSFKNTYISYQNGLLQLAQMEKNKTPTYQVDVTYLPLNQYTDSPYSTDYKYGMTLRPEFSYVSYDNKLSFGGELGYTMDYEGNSIMLSPGVDASYNFDFSGYEPETMEDLNYTIMRLNTEYTYKSAEINFEKTVLSTIRTLYSAEKSMETIDESIDDLETTIDTIDKLKTISPDSTLYKNNLLMLEKNKETKALLERQFEDAKNNYKTLTGLDWDGVDSLPSPKLELKTLPNGNTEVLLASLNIQLAEETLKSLEADYDPNGLLISGGVRGSYTAVDGPLSGQDLVAVNASLRYSGKNWSISATPSLSWSFPQSSDALLSPSLTISGSWRNNTTNVYENAELSKKQNDVVTRQNQYVQAMTNYVQSGQNLSVSIMDWNFKMGQADSNIAYLKEVRDNQAELYEKGLITKEELDDAELDIKLAEYDRDDLILQGLILDCDLALYAL